MSYKGPEIVDIPPGWTTVEELRDNLVEYMMLQSPYKELSGEDMPSDMVVEMEKSMTRLAMAVFHSIDDWAKTGTYESHVKNSITGKGTVELPLQLVNDIETPPALSYYGTNLLNQKGYHSLESLVSPTEKSGSITTVVGEFDIDSLDINEVPTGNVDGVNKVFTLSEEPHETSVRVYLNGVRQKPILDYTISSTTLTFVGTPYTGDRISVHYIPKTEPNISTRFFNKIPDGSTNGSNQYFTLPQRFSLETIYKNGVRQIKDYDYGIIGRDIVFIAPPWANDIILVDYKPLITKVFGEVPKGDVDSINTEFILLNIPIILSVYVNGILYKEVDDYTINNNVINLLIPPYTGDIILTDYCY